MGNLHKVKITDLVKDDYESWKQGSMIFIFSGTGSGKTTLALEKITISYIDKGKSVLYLVPRELLRKEINKVMQSIIAKSEYKKCEIKENHLIEPIEEPYIDYDVSLVTLAETLPEPEKQDTIEDIIKKIDNVLDKNITQNGKKEHIEAKNLDIYMYKLPNHYDYLNVQYLTNNDNIYEIIKNSPKEEKTIIFVNNKKNGEDIQNKLNKNNIKSI